MKAYYSLFIVLILCILCSVSSVFADGLAPITNQQSYPIPQLYPIGQYPNQNNYPGPANPNPPQNNPPQQYQPWQQQYYPQQQPWQQQYYSQPYYYDQNTIYDPYSGMYYYKINNDQWSYPYQQPSYPYYQNRNIQVSKQTNYDGSVCLNWLLRNVTNEEWGKKNVDIKCISGCHLLINPIQTLWDLPYTVPRSGTLSFTVNIWQPMYGETMTFSIVAGSKTLYTFDVNPN